MLTKAFLSNRVASDNGSHLLNVMDGYGPNKYPVKYTV